MSLSELIMSILKYRRGEDWALPRQVLLRELRRYNPDLTDRCMRRAYEDLPICSGPTGLFIPTSKAEIEKYERYLSQKIPPWKAKEKIEKLRKTYPEFWKKQLELFCGQ